MVLKAATRDVIAQTVKEMIVAKVLRASGGDAHRARALAISARDHLATLVGKYGQAVTDSIAEISAWLAAG